MYNVLSNCIFKIKNYIFNRLQEKTKIKQIVHKMFAKSFNYLELLKI